MVISPLEEIKGLYIIYGSRLHLLLVDQVDFDMRPMLGNPSVAESDLCELPLLVGFLLRDVLDCLEGIAVVAELLVTLDVSLGNFFWAMSDGELDSHFNYYI